MLNRFIQFIGGRRVLRPAPHIQAVARHNHYAWPNLAETAAQARIYQQSPWVYIAINRIAEAVALVPLRVVRLSPVPDVGAVMSPDGERRIEVERHPLERLLDAPNPYLSRFELFEQTAGMLELCGNAYWFLGGDSSGVPAEIWPLRPDRVSVVPDSERYIKGYVYEIDGTRIPLDSVEVVHFKRWHPSNDYYGLSALEAARLAVTGDRAMAEWNRNTFGVDNGVPAGIVSVKEYVNDADFDRIKREWRQTYGGTQRRTAFLRGGGIEWHNIGLSHTELDFLRGREAHRDEILNIYGIPVGLVSENATEANAKVAERLFIERTLWPKLTRISQKITQELLPFWPGDHVAEFEDIRPTDTAARMDEIRTAYPLLSINEIRARYYQLPAVEWGTLPIGAANSAPPYEAEVGKVGGGTPTATVANPANGKSLALPPGDAPSLGIENSELGTSTQHFLSELGRWEKFALKRWGRTGARAFEVRALPGEVAFAVSAGLLAAESVDEIKQVFDAAREAVKALDLEETVEA